jgi:putative flippase GtrA
MAVTENRLGATLWQRLRGKMGVRFTRFVVVAVAALSATEITLTLCNGVFHMTATPAALVSWFAGAVVSYVLSRWAWERKGKPDVLRETIPFWVISAMVIVILTLATKLAYHSASWMNLNGARHVLWVDFVWLVANFCTFLLRFVIFHYVLFAERTTAARAAATGPDAVPPGTRGAPRPAEAPHSAAPAATAETSAGAAAKGSAPATRPAPPTTRPAPATRPAPPTTRPAPATRPASADGPTASSAPAE